MLLFIADNKRVELSGSMNSYNFASVYKHLLKLYHTEMLSM